ncbi:MAG: primosomal protein N' [Gallionellales bacterium 35-53-114]|jgi:primosomal protein N' (replication factor Y)|nr:MAG: primosomal protein N' [Gallionellales bacterium 35-53-114]OYZ64523.1 MAG: primosomal protein N' [Gallionellales bacterium 24-53-125]OZB10171.1 MAG: primosomal protein N' [Gallionellales bacterium 39-52-133]HQS56760.1 primosomal protein N' [Gallionellaceae bacterium]HQS75456.1 primosomal protein N' [Gallionellaceae bacterium]
MRIVRVALDVPLSTLFDYYVAENMPVVAGQRVVVPFGHRQVVGVVMELAASSDFAATRIKEVVQVLNDVSPLPAEMLKLLRFCSDYYHHPVGMTVLSALPTRLRNPQAVVLKQALTYSLSDSGKALDLDQLPKRKQVQLRILRALQEGSLSAAQIKAISATAPAALKQLIEAGWVEAGEASAPCAKFTFNEEHRLTAEQQAAVDAVNRAQGFAAFLLHGITGSGKTEVYVHLLQQILQRGGQVLLLVPEINLTPQLEYYFRSRFPDTELVSLHSGLNEGERTQNWLLAQSGRARIILGTRLAVFTPLPNLALIIVDEEHDASFKQQDGLHYSARDVAIFRANARAVPIVLGSATPSLESYYNAKSGRYTLLKLTERASQLAQLPSVRCINISNELMPEGISQQLLSALGERLLRGEQSLVFINRRGYAPVLMCTACGWLSGCPNCAGKMVLHLKDRRLRCHHCGHQTRVPPACPSCGNADLQPVGIGTQRIETALQAHFPDARILRVDRDSTRNKGTWNAMRKQIQDEAVDILVGTQMLAKGHDFHNLTLVCVLSPDSALYSGDFRASEKLFAQLAQVSGRAGRGDKPGEVLVQTAFPEHPLFRALRAHDYDAWAATLLTEREQAGFPPFVYQVLLRCEGKQEAEVYEFMRQARSAATGLVMQVEVYGVVAAAMPRRANHIRVQLLVQSDARKSLQQFLRKWQPLLEAIPAKQLRWSVDVDPLEF